MPQDQMPIDLELIAQRIVLLAEIAAQEHLASLARSQAEGVLDLAREAELESA